MTLTETVAAALREKYWFMEGSRFALIPWCDLEREDKQEWTYIAATTLSAIADAQGDYAGLIERLEARTIRHIDDLDAAAAIRELLVQVAVTKKEPKP